MTRLRYLLHQIGLHWLCRIGSKYVPGLSEFVPLTNGDVVDVTNQSGYRRTFHY